MRYIFFLKLTLILMLFSCKDDDNSSERKFTEGYRYVFTFEFVNLWNVNIFPNEYPANASWGAFTGLTSGNSENSFFQENINASNGLTNYANANDNTSLVQEISQSVMNTYNLINVNTDDSIKETYTFEFSATKDQPFLTVISKMIPSPDWFIAIKDIDLNILALGGQVRYYVNVYDIGVNDGNSYTSNGAKTNNNIAIKLDYPLVNSNDQYENIGFVKISYKSREKI